LLLPPTLPGYFLWRFSVPTASGKTPPADTTFLQVLRESLGALCPEDQLCSAVALEGYPSRIPRAYLLKKRATLGLLRLFLEVLIGQHYHCIVPPTSSEMLSPS
jgi:hypothetical protein